MPSGRRTIDPAEWDRLLEQIADGLTLNAACDRVGIGRTTVWKRRREDPDFARAFDEAFEQGTETYREELRQRAFDRDDSASADLLKFELRRRDPAYHAPSHQRLEITGRAGGPIEIEDRSASLSDVARVLEAVGALAQLRRAAPLGELPPAGEVLAEPSGS